MKKGFLVLLLLSIVPLCLSAQIHLDYREGFMEIRVAGEWSELYLGDEIPAGSVIRLSENGYAEIQAYNSMISLIEDGSYEVSELIAGLAEQPDIRLDLKKKLTLDTEYEKWRHEATMGVRGSAQEAPDSPLSMEDALTYLEEGLELMSSDNTVQAESKFSEGWDFFQDDTCLFLAALCQEDLGKKALFVRNMSRVNPAALDELFYPVYVIRQAELLIQSRSYGKAEALLKEAVNLKLKDRDEQTLYLLLGKSALKSGDMDKARMNFLISQEIDPSSEEGLAARRALEKL